MVGPKNPITAWLKAGTALFEGRNITIEYRWAEGRADRASEIAAEFVRSKVDVIVTGGTANVVAAMQRACRHYRAPASTSKQEP